MTSDCCEHIFRGKHFDEKPDIWLRAKLADSIMTHLRSSLGTLLHAIAPASTKYFRDMSSIPLVVNITFAPADRIFWILSFVMSNSRSLIFSSSLGSLTNTYETVWVNWTDLSVLIPQLLEVTTAYYSSQTCHPMASACVCTSYSLSWDMSRLIVQHKYPWQRSMSNKLFLVRWHAARTYPLQCPIAKYYRHCSCGQAYSRTFTVCASQQGSTNLPRHCRAQVSHGYVIEIWYEWHMQYLHLWACFQQHPTMIQCTQPAPYKI